MHSVVTRSELEQRGVYRAVYTVKGWPVLVAIDSKGDARKHIKLTPDVDEVKATLWLRAWLDRVDPVRPPLRLVKPAPPPRQISDLAHADPRQWEDHLAFALRMARANGKKYRRLRPD